MFRFLRFLLFFACTPPAGHRNRTEGNEENEAGPWCGGLDGVGASWYLDTANTRLLGSWYARFRRSMRQNGIRIPKNRDAAGGRRGDKLLRFRDCAVIDYAVSRLADTERISYQTVRGVFLEGGPAFPGSEIAQIAHSDRGEGSERHCRVLPA